MDFSKGEPASPSAALMAEIRQHRSVPDCENPDEEGLFMEKDLALDAPWKRIQQNTFTRWVNEHLKSVHLSLANLETGFADGLLLIGLVEVLSGKKLPKHNKKPVFRSQKLENVSVALTFLEQEEGIKLVSIDSTDIVDSRLKLILGLVWSLILHYALSKPKWEGDLDSDAQGKKLTPKQRLITWFHHKMPELPITNFTTDWNDGRACGALDNAVAPGLCPDWKEWNPRDALRNATEAMTLAEKWLGVPQLISPEDMIDPNIDEQSMMTYLAQFPIAKVNADAPLRTMTRRSSQMSVRSSVIARADLVKCSGRGIQHHGIRTGDVVNIKISTKDAGKGDLDLSILAPDGSLEKFDMQQSSDSLYEAYYCPALEGRYVINIMYGGQHVPRSPFQVNVKPALASNIRVYGPGLTSGAAGHPADFHVDMNGEAGMLSFLIEGPSEVKIECKDRGDLVAQATYWPTTAGEYAVHIHCDNDDIHGSPFMAEIKPLPVGVHPDKVRVELSGLEGVEAGQPVEIIVNCRDSGKAPLEVLVTDGDFDTVAQKVEIEPDVWRYSFVPNNDGCYVVLINYAGVSVGDSPYKIPVKSSLDMIAPRPSRSNENFLSGLDLSSLRIAGFQPKVQLNTLTEMTVDCRDIERDGNDMLKVGICSPSGIPSEAMVSEKAPGLYNVCYSVFEEGPHTVSISFGGIPVQGTPLMVTAVQDSVPVAFNGADVQEYVKDTMSEEVTGDGTTIIRREVRTVREVVSNMYTESIMGSPIGGVQNPMAVLDLARGDASKVVVSGEGLYRAFVNKPNKFVVKAEAAGYNVLMVGVYGKILNAHEVKMAYKGEAQYDVVYELKDRGEYLLIIKYGDHHVSGSPFIIQCQ